MFFDFSGNFSLLGGDFFLVSIVTKTSFLGRGLLLELLHGLTGLGNVDVVVGLHRVTSPFLFRFSPFFWGLAGVSLTQKAKSIQKLQASITKKMRARCKAKGLQRAHIYAIL